MIFVSALRVVKAYLPSRLWKSTMLWHLSLKENIKKVQSLQK
jgi:hypothetical protein